MLRRTEANFRFLVIPITAIFILGMLTTAYILVTQESLAWFYNFVSPIGFDFSLYNDISILIPTAVIFTFFLWCGIYRLVKLPSLSKKERPNALLVLLTLAVSVILAIASSEKTGAELLFVLFPLSIVTANHLERIKELLFKESLLWLLVILPIILLFI